MESTSARDLDRRLADLVRGERHLAVQFVIELASFAKHELHRELGYTSLFHYCVRQLGLSKASAFRRSEVARLIVRFPVIPDRLTAGGLSIRALVELREVLTEENHAAVLARIEGKSQEEAQLLAVEYRPRPIPRDVVRRWVPAQANKAQQPPVSPAGLSHRCPDGDFEQVVREAFKLVLARDRKRKALTTRPRAPSGQRRLETSARGCPAAESPAPECPAAECSAPRTPERKDRERFVPAAIRRAVWERDQGRCTWPMGDASICGSTHRLELDQALEVARGGKATIGNLRLLCKSHNLLKAERLFGKAFRAKFGKARPAERDTSWSEALAGAPADPGPALPRLKLQG